MRRFHQLVFVLSLLTLSWLAMQTVHELGHIVGGVATGGTVERVVLSPLTISRTDVASSRHPAIVVWLGPIAGCLLPLLALAVLPRGFAALRKIGQFFAGFCLVANGAYISVGSLNRIGDAGELLRMGMPIGVLWAFGVPMVAIGLLIWHRLGSLERFLADPSCITPRMAAMTLAALAVLLVAEFAISS